MKKLISVALFVTVSFGSIVGQIPIRETGIAEKVAPCPERFDSLSNIRPLERGEEPYNILKYLEQEIFFIPITNDVISKEVEREKVYNDAQNKLDSLETMQAEAIKAKNQGLYITLIPKVSSQRQKVVNLTPRPYSPYGPRGAKGNVGFFKCDSIGNITERVLYSDVQNKYFAITELVKCSVDSNGKGKFSKTKEYSSYGLGFLLQERETRDSLIWIFDKFKEYSTVDFALLTSYFNKVQTSFQGRTLISTYDNSVSVDINTGEEVNVPKGSKWVCKELTLIPTHDAPLLAPFFILENQTGETTIAFRLRDKISSTTSLSRGRLVIEEQYVYEEEQKQMREEQRLAEQKAKEEQRLKEEADFKQKCISKYGQKYGTLIISGKVTLGMNREMCSLAWGEPYRKNRTIVNGLTREQWVYGWYHYLYFDNGILVGIQD